MEPDKTTVVPQDQQVVTPEPVTDPGYTHDDLQKDSIRDIVANTDEPKPAEVKPVEDEPKPEVVEPVIDPKQIAEDAARKVIEEQEARKIAEAIADEPKELTPSEQQYEDWAKKFNDDNSRPPTYLEAMGYVEEQAVAKIEARQAQKAKEQEDAQKAEQAQKEEENRNLQTFVDDEMSDLYSDNRLTRVVDAKNPSDQGVVERREFFKTWKEVNDQRRSEGKPEIISATRIYHSYFKKPTAMPPGADAPISGNRASGVSPSEQAEYTNADLKKPWGFFKRGGN